MPLEYDHGPSRAERGMMRFRATLHVGMGFLYLVLGVSVILLQAFGRVPLDQWMAVLLGSLMILYGLFRLWRGWADWRLLRRGRL